MKKALDEDEIKDIKEEILYYEKLLAALNKDLDLWNMHTHVVIEI